MSKKEIIEQLKSKIEEDFTKDMALVLSILQKHGAADFTMNRELKEKRKNNSTQFKEFEMGEITVIFTLTK